MKKLMSLFLIMFLGIGLFVIPVFSQDDPGERSGSEEQTADQIGDEAISAVQQLVSLIQEQTKIAQESVRIAQKAQADLAEMVEEMAVFASDLAKVKEENAKLGQEILELQGIRAERDQMEAENLAVMEMYNDLTGLMEEILEYLEPPTDLINKIKQFLSGN